MSEINLNNFAQVGAYASKKSIENAQEQAATSVMKTARDQQADNIMQLVTSVTPEVPPVEGNLGQNINTKI